MKDNRPLNEVASDMGFNLNEELISEAKADSLGGVHDEYLKALTALIIKKIDISKRFAPQPRTKFVDSGRGMEIIYWSKKEKERKNNDATGMMRININLNQAGTTINWVLENVYPDSKRVQTDKLEENHADSWLISLIADFWVKHTFSVMDDFQKKYRTK